MTATGNAFIIPNAFMLGMDHIVNGDTMVPYEIQDGDTVRFVA